MTDPAFPAATSTDPHAAEGWHHDPSGRHEHRWYSAGTPTALVRDSGAEGWIEGRDEPVDLPDGAPQPVEGLATRDGADLVRADAAEAGTVSAADLRRSDDGGPRRGLGVVDVGTTQVPAD